MNSELSTKARITEVLGKTGKQNDKLCAHVEESPYEVVLVIFENVLPHCLKKKKKNYFQND